MIRLTFAAATLLALTGAASAMTGSNELLQSEVKSYVSGVDVGSLTDAQVEAIKLAVYSGDSASEIRAFIQSIVNG
jgi:hypothetical protein